MFYFSVLITSLFTYYFIFEGKELHDQVIILKYDACVFYPILDEKKNIISLIKWFTMWLLAEV